MLHSHRPDSPLPGTDRSRPPRRQRGPLRIEITEGVIEPLPFAVPTFVAENAGGRAMWRDDITRVIAADLTGTGLFREIPAEAFISRASPASTAPVQYADWKAINAQALVTGAVSVDGDGRLTVKFRLFDVFSEAPLGEGLQFGGDASRLAADGAQGRRPGL